MCRSRSERTGLICLLSLILGFTPVVLEGAPLLQNVSIPPGGENSIFVLSAHIRRGGGGEMTVRVNWGDGSAMGVYNYPTNTTIAIGHYYQDRPASSATDLYALALSLSNSVGMVATNLEVVVTNVPPRPFLSVNSPIEIGAPQSLRGLEVTEFPLAAGSFPQGIAAGPDGNVWFTETGSNRVGRITPSGVITEFALSGGALNPVGIVAGSDDRLWFCAYTSGQIGAITTNGVVTMYTVPRAANEPIKTPQYIIRGAGTVLWYSDFAYRIGRVTPAGTISQRVFPDGINPFGLALGYDNDIWLAAFYSDVVIRYRPSDGTTNHYRLDDLSSPAMMTRGPDSAIWFTQYQAGRIGRIGTNGVLMEASVGRSGPYGITTGPDGAIWFTERRIQSTNAIVRLTLEGQLSRYSVPMFSDPREIVTGPDGALWFTLSGRDRIGRIRYTTAGNVVLLGSLNDPGTYDPHVVDIDWGDGTPVERLNLPAGIASFSPAHTYSGAQPSYTITVTATDDEMGTSTTSTLVVVDLIRFTSITRSPSGEVRLNGVAADGRSITIENSPDLVNWSTVGTATPVGNSFEFVHPSGGDARRFYRGKLP